MHTPGEHTRHEILSQPAAWASTLEVIRAQSRALQGLFPPGRHEAVIFTGCGSTYYLSLAAASLLQELTQVPARGVPASEVWLHPVSALPPGQRILLIAVSRSGETTETLRACQTFLEGKRGRLLTLSCYPEGPLAQLGYLNLVFPGAQETSVAQTRAFTSLYLAAVGAAALAADRQDLLDGMERLPELGRRVLSSTTDLARQLASQAGLDRFYFLGSGSRYGLACELSLKMKEMSLSHSEPFHFLEFRHGPQSMVSPSALVVGLLSGTDHTHEAAVLESMHSRGARVLSLGEAGTDIAFASSLPEIIRGVLYLPFGQLLAYERALFCGQDPDRPHNLEAVVKLDAA
jgi:glucosamine--fructose-6-phosphate aminotransferase (isomerizing)